MKNPHKGIHLAILILVGLFYLACGAVPSEDFKEKGLVGYFLAEETVEAASDPVVAKPQTIGAAERELFAAVKQVRLGAVLDLIDQGANLNVINEDKQTPLEVAVRGKNREMAIVLHEAGALVTGDVLLAVVEQGHMALMDDLCKGRTNPDQRTRAGTTPLIGAVRQGTPDMVTRLLRCGANPAFTDLQGDIAETYVLKKENLGMYPDFAENYREIRRQLLAVRTVN